ncbi:MAG: hypothetical protein AAGA58_08930 [Verrucomicrobiota bacterium]
MKKQACKIAVIAAVAAGFFANSVAYATEETVTLKIGETVSVPDGKVAEFKSAFIYLPNATTEVIRVEIFGTIQGETVVLPRLPLSLVVPTQSFGGGNTSAGVPNIPLTMEGPVDFQLGFREGEPGADAIVQVVMCIRDKVKNQCYSSGGASPGTTIPKCAVVIPSDATGNVEIKLESSIDMVNWTAALPGLYGASTDNRFFRVRAEQQ